jgi:hypothetical protein
MPPIRFTPDEVRGWRYAGTRVVGAPDAVLGWQGMDATFASSKGITQGAIVVDSAGGTGANDANTEFVERVRRLVTTEPTRSEYRTFIVSQSHGPLSAAMGAELAGRMLGQRDVRVEIAIKRIIIVHSAVRILVDLIQTLKLEVKLVDNRSGEVLAVYPELTVIVQRRGGVAGILIDAAISRPDIEELSALAAIQVRNWLFVRPAGS